MRDDYCEDPRVCAAREHQITAMDGHEFPVDPSEERKKCVDDRKEELYGNYTKAREEVVIAKIMRVERAADKTCKSTGRKRGSSSQIQGSCPKDRSILRPY